MKSGNEITRRTAEISATPHSSGEGVSARIRAATIEILVALPGRARAGVETTFCIVGEFTKTTVKANCYFAEWRAATDRAGAKATKDQVSALSLVD